MANRLHQLVLALALTGLAGAALAQTGPDSAGSDSNAPPGGAHQHAWQDRGQGGGHGQWGDEGRGDREGGGWHRHHHHHHHHHHRGHGHWGRGGWGRHGHDGGMMGGPGLMRRFRGLDLTPAQREQVHTILSSAREQHAKMRPAGGPDMMALANPGDPNYATAVQAAKKRAADRIQAGSDLQLKLYNILTPQQKAQLTKSLAERKAKMEQWKTQRAKGANGAPGNQ